MSRQFIDDDLTLWEVHASTGQFSLPDHGRLVFLCVTDPQRRPRSVRYQGGLVESEAAVESLPDEELRALLAASEALS
jgi:hypothetical protein